jgi:ferredoxin
MADKNSKTNGNVSGSYYVDTMCTGCGVCEGEAPDNFKLNDEGVAIVFKQPENDNEKQKCENALEQCPVEAIGNDG